MSVCMSLYKIVNNVEYEGCDEYYNNIWSDNLSHIFFDWTYYNTAYLGKRGSHRIRKRMKNMPFKICDNIIPQYEQHKYLCVDEVVYAQGWFLKKKFYKKKNPTIICTTKEQMLNFFKQYIDYNSHDTRGKAIVEQFTNAWEDGMLFECAW